MSTCLFPFIVRLNWRSSQEKELRGAFSISGITQGAETRDENGLGDCLCPSKPDLRGREMMNSLNMLKVLRGS